MKDATTHDAVKASAITSEWTPLHAARLAVCRLLALVASDPRSARWQRLGQEEFIETARAAAAFLGQEPAAMPQQLAPGERTPADLDLASLAEALDAPHDDLVEEYDRVFGLVASKECPVYETDYCPQTFSVYRSQQMADVAGYYSAFGLQPSRDMPERPDHVAMEIEFLAWLLAKEHHALRPDNDDATEQASVCRDAQKSFVQAHLAWWLPAFAHALQRKTGGAEGVVAVGYLSELARILAAWVPIERAVLGVEPPIELAAPNPADENEVGCGSCGEGV